MLPWMILYAAIATANFIIGILLTVDTNDATYVIAAVIGGNNIFW